MLATHGSLNPGRRPLLQKSKCFAGGLDVGPIMPLRAWNEVFSPNSARKETTHETGHQDCRPDRRISGHIFVGHRSSGSRRGWRPTTSVPTQINYLPIQLADLTYGRPV